MSEKMAEEVLICADLSQYGTSTDLMRSINSGMPVVWVLLGGEVL
jgi:hypothetical protein